MLAEYGLLISRHNWLKPNWLISHSTFQGTFIDSGGNITGSDPGFVDFNNEDFHLLSTSQCIDNGTFLAPQTLPQHNVLYQYIKHRRYENRPNDGLFDIGAFEYSAGGVVDEIKIREINRFVFAQIEKEVFRFTLPETGYLKFYDSQGRLIYNTGKIGKGIYIWNGNTLPPGVYFYIFSNQKNETRIGKLILLR